MMSEKDIKNAIEQLDKNSDEMLKQMALTENIGDVTLLAAQRDKMRAAMDIFIMVLNG